MELLFDHDKLKMIAATIANAYRMECIPPYFDISKFENHHSQRRNETDKRRRSKAKAESKIQTQHEKSIFFLVVILSLHSSTIGCVIR